MIYKARELALQVLYEYETSNTYISHILEKYLNKLQISDVDKRLAVELVYGTIRYQGRLDWILNCYLKRNILSLTPWIRNILRLGVYQLQFLQRIPQSAAINESVKLAHRYGHRGTANLTNAILRNTIRKPERVHFPNPQKEPIAYLSSFYSHPEWLIKPWINRYGFEFTKNLCIANNQKAPLSLRINTNKISVEEYYKLLKEANYKIELDKEHKEFIHLTGNAIVKQLPNYKEGYFQIQDVSAGWISYLLQPLNENERILDMCAAPGGKATHLAQLKANVFALDIAQIRSKIIQENALRLDLVNLYTITADAFNIPFNQKFNRILLDAPCSGTGVFRRRLDARWRLKAEDLSELIDLQRKLLKVAISYLAKDGILVYSTCTLEAEENELQIKWLLKEYPNIKLESVESYVPTKYIDKEGYYRVYPNIHNSDGALGARLSYKK